MQFTARRTVVAYLVLALLTGGLVAASEALKSERPPSADGARGNARRFLDMSSGVPTTASGRPSRMAASADDEGPAAPIEGDYTPQGWTISPAGRQVEVMRFPLGLAANADASKVVVSSDSGGMQALTTIDAASLSAVATPAANLFMGVAVTPEGRVFASGGNADRVFRLRLAGPTLVHEDVTEAATFPTHAITDAAAAQLTGQAPAPSLPVADGIRVPGYPGNSVLDGNLLYVAGTLSEPGGTPSACPGGAPACARISIVDTTTSTVVKRIPVGLDAYALALDAATGRLYVSNWADEAGRGAGQGGTVSVVDLRSGAEIAYTVVGHHPSAVQLSADRTRLFVANTNDDTISVLDVTKTPPSVVTTESVRPSESMPVGAHPDAFALSPDGSRLFVALAGMNAVEVRDGRSGARLAAKPLYIPTGWYPSALLVTGTAEKYRLWVTNAKGSGPGPGYNLSVGPHGTRTNGTVSVIDLPAANGQLEKWTAQVRKNDKLTGRVDPCKPAGARKSEVLCPPRGKRSPIRHVVYIVTENKTFDQYFGDLDPSRYDADPTYLLYGEQFTPNHHAWVDRYSLNDRFFSDAEVSVTGHSWTSGAIATDHNEKTWHADYDQGIRGGRGGEADDELEDPEGGYIFEAFKRAGAKPPLQGKGRDLTMAIYGEGTARESGDMSAYKAKGTRKDGEVADWKEGDIQYFDTCRANMFITGEAGDGPAPDEDPVFGDCAGRTLDEQFTLKKWSDVHRETGRDVMPNFIYMVLPVNHTLGTNLGSPTPASMVADNDHALGLIVDALSRSPFWESTVVMMTEDDTQAAGDHISPLRDYLQVVGPWAKPGPNHQWGSFPSILRTIEHIFGVEPITLFDKQAVPQHGAFRTKLKDKPDTRPYTAIRPNVPFALNQPGAPGQAASMAMDWSTYDRIDEATLNAILYTVMQGRPLRLPAYAPRERPTDLPSAPA